MGRRHFPLRTHLLALVVGTLLPALILAAFLLRRVAADNREALDRRLRDGARAQAAVIDGELVGTIRGLQALAESEAVRGADLSVFYDQAKRAQRSQPTWNAVVLSARDRQLINTLVPFGRPLGPAVDPDSIATAFQMGRPIVGGVKPGPQGGLAFAVRVPVKETGQVTRVLSAVITPAALVTVMSQEPFTDEWARGIVDTSGTVVARIPDPDRFVGQRATDNLMRLLALREDGVYRDTALDGSRVYVGYSHGPVSGWLSAVAVRVEVVDALARESVLAFVVVGGFLMALGGAGTFIISRRISRDIEDVAMAADALASGQEPSISASSVSEVQRLSTALGHSASMLHARERERDEHIARADEARRVAEAADLAKDDFLATLGHELRNPLAPALTALHLMRLRGDAGQAREREIVERQVRHLARLVDDLLDVSRARNGRIELRRHPFEIVHAIEIAIEIASPLITSRRHRLTVDVPPNGLVIHGDETRLAQVFANLLNNAAKFSDGPGQISITARADGDNIIVRCVDDGLGIDRALLPRVFDQFAQGRQSLSREQGGLGLGLAVAKTLVELHGGRIEANSDGPGCGSVFTVRLPRTVAKPAAPPVEASELPPSSEGRRVLVVDDNHDAAEMLGDMLRLAGFAVATAFDGVAALRLNQSFQAHVAVLDIGLPTMDGLELARRLKQSETGRRIRLIAMTGYGQASDIDASHAAGFDRHLVKPVIAQRLFEAIGELDGDPPSDESGAASEH